MDIFTKLCFCFGCTGLILKFRHKVFSSNFFRNCKRSNRLKIALVLKERKRERAMNNIAFVISIVSILNSRSFLSKPTHLLCWIQSQMACWTNTFLIVFGIYFRTDIGLTSSTTVKSHPTIVIHDDFIFFGLMWIKYLRENFKRIAITFFAKNKIWMQRKIFSVDVESHSTAVCVFQKMTRPVCLLLIKFIWLPISFQFVNTFSIIATAKNLVKLTFWDEKKSMLSRISIYHM